MYIKSGLLFLVVGITTLILIGCRITKQVDKLALAPTPMPIGPLPQAVLEDDLGDCTNTTCWDGVNLNTNNIVTKYFDVTPLIAKYSIMACLVQTSSINHIEWNLMTSSAPTMEYLIDIPPYEYRRVYSITFDKSKMNCLMRGELVMR